MVRVAAKLIILFFLIYSGVHWGYARLEKELLRAGCCAPKTSGPDKLRQAEKKTRQTVSETTSKTTLLDQSDGLGNNDTSTGQLDFQVINRRNIFQTVSAPRIAQPAQEEEVDAAPAAQVQTTLNVDLLGTVTGTDQTARAIIIDKDKKKQKLYQIGDTVQGATVESIERGKVTLEVFGSIETLLMKKREGGGAGYTPRLPRRITRPVPRIPLDDIEDIETDDEDIETDDEENEDDAVKENKAKRTRRAPAVRPHRRVNFRRNPAQAEPEGGEEEQDNELPAEEELPY